jgi:hypothetical protein
MLRGKFLIFLQRHPRRIFFSSRHLRSSNASAIWLLQR